MLEYGQPLHAYRLDRLAGAIQVRYAQAQESLTLLDGTELSLDDQTLVIADDSGAIGLAGIMGGLSTAVDAETDAIFLESAFFAQNALQGRARRYGLHTDASLRFERGVDPSGQERAIERASALLLEIAGGDAGPLVLAEAEDQVPVRQPVSLNEATVTRMLGMTISRDEIETHLRQLDMQVESTDGGWQVTAPSYRFDIAIEEDLIEELARMVGYDQIPVTAGSGQVRLARADEDNISPQSVTDLLVARGFNEVVTFSFTEGDEQARVTGTEESVPLANPISRDLNVLRRSLWPGLLRCAAFNLSRQIERCRLFEVGTAFAPAANGVAETTLISGLIVGSSRPPHWEGASAEADFFDLKAEVEAVLSMWKSDQEFRFEAEVSPGLNPARAAVIRRGQTRVGSIGELHPALQSTYEFREPVLMFEIDLLQLGNAAVPKFEAFSKFPSTRRDLAVIVDESITAAQLTDNVTEALGPALRRCEIFDIYRGPAVDSGRKSVGMGLILQDASRTLNDEETDDMMQRVMRHLERKLEATIRN